MKRLGVAFLAAAVAAGCGDEETVEPAGPDFDRIEADQVMVGVEHYLTDEGVRKAHLRSDTVFFLDDGSTARLRRFTVDFFGPEGARTSVLTAEDGVYDLREGDMRAESDVVVVDSEDSQRLTTERLTYDSSDDELESDVDFMLVRGRDTLTGTGFVTDPGLDSLVTRRPSVVSPGDSIPTPGSADSVAGSSDTAAGASGTGAEEDDGG